MKRLRTHPKSYPLAQNHHLSVKTFLALISIATAMLPRVRKLLTRNLAILVWKKDIGLVLINFVVATFSLCLTLGAVVPTAVTAANLPAPMTQFAACDKGSFFGFPTWYACLPKDNTGHPKLTKLEDLWLIFFPLIETGIKVAGYAAVGFALWGGIRFIKSQGNPGEITAARDTIRDATIGLIICIASVAIVQFVASRL